MKTLQVFLSHTSDMALFPEDRPFVQAALDAVGRARMAPVDMRYFAARDGRPAHYCQQQVLTCDVYVAIVGFRYGSIVSGGDVSYTELEFLSASAARLPRLVFLLAENAYSPTLADSDLGLVEGFRSRLSGAGLIVREFRSGDSLELEIFHALSELANHWQSADVSRPGLAAMPGGVVPGDPVWSGGRPLADAVVAGGRVSRLREMLSRSYTSALTEPITPAGDMPVGLKIPTLEMGYIDHRIRVAEITASSDPGRESWWANVPIIESARNYLFTYVTSPTALAAPLLLLGQPGSGKSVLTRILAAQFSSVGFLPVRVELRQADAEDDLLAEYMGSNQCRTSCETRSAFAARRRGHVLRRTGRFDRLDTSKRSAIAEMLMRLHSRALFRQDESAYSRYEPFAVSVVARHAAWSANLVVLAVLAAGEITGGRLFPQEQNPQLAWRAEALVWRSQLSGNGWEGLHETIAFHREWANQLKTFRLTRIGGTFIPKDLDMSWTFDRLPDARERVEVFSAPAHNSLMTRRKINFASNMSEDIMAHDLAPLIPSFPTTANVFVMLDDGRAVSAVHALIAALSAPYRESAPEESIYLDLAQVTRSLIEASNVTQDASYLKMALGVLIAAVSRGAVSIESIRPITRLIDKVAGHDARLAELMASLDKLISELPIIE